MKKLQLLLIALVCSLATNAQMVLEYEIPTTGDSIALPLNGTVDVTVDWGDGSQEDFTSTGNQWHVYETDGKKTVTITGALTHFGDNNDGNNYLTKVLSWDDIGLTSLAKAFYKSPILIQVPDYLPETVTEINSMFYKAEIFNQEIESWNTTNITNMGVIFCYATAFNQPIGNWNTASVTNMNSMFSFAYAFNQDISQWNTSSVTDMGRMFNYARAFNQPIGEWNTENVTVMTRMFDNAKAFKQKLNDWNTGNVQKMDYMFYGTVLNEPLDKWDTKSVTTMRSMFDNARVFNQPIGNWNTSSVTDMSGMFITANNFNQDIGGWNTSSVRDMSNMFNNSNSFNQDISNWNTSSVTRMYQMFVYAKIFNHPIGKWNTSNVTDMGQMFSHALLFNHPLGAWDISSVTSMRLMFSYTSLCTENYDATLNGWATQAVKEGVQFDAGYSKYSEEGADARAILAEKWTITDGDQEFSDDYKCVPEEMVLEYEIPEAGDSIALALRGTQVAVMVDWGDGTTETFATARNCWHVYTTTGTKTVTITGKLTHFGVIYSSNFTGNQFLTKVKSWGNLGLTDLSGAFYNANLLTEVPNSLPQNVTNLKSIFYRCALFNAPIGNWNTVNVTDMSSVFYGASSFNQAIGEWDVSSVTDMQRMFYGTSLCTENYDATLNGWAFQTIQDGITFDGGNSNYSEAGAGARATLAEKWIITDGGLGINEDDKCIPKEMVLEYEIPSADESIALPLNGTVDVTVDWGDGSQEDFTEAGNKEHTYATEGTRTVTITGSLTTYGSNQNQEGNKYLTKVISWHLPELSSLSFAFYGAKNLTEVPSNLPLGVTNLGWMFSGASSFNQSLNEWNTERVTSMKHMFSSAYSFNGSINNWNTSNVTDMTTMFKGATSFNQPIYNWNTSAVTDMAWMFADAWGFDQNISNWNTENVTNMAFMFYKAKAFNKPIGTWNLKSVESLMAMFLEAESFNQSIENWNIDSVKHINGIFGGASLFNQPLNGWNTENITSFEGAFQDAIAFNQPLDNWNTSSVTDMQRLFYGAKSFNQQVGMWDISSVTSMESMLDSTALSVCNYDSTLNSWASQAIQEDVIFDAVNSQYSEAGADARATLAESWTITDGGLTSEDDKCLTTLSSDDFYTMSDFEIYPNPVVDKLYLSASSLFCYAIYNITGSIVEEAEVFGQETEIDLSNFPSGVYILQTASEAGVQTQRFTKQ